MNCDSIIVFLLKEEAEARVDILINPTAGVIKSTRVHGRHHLLNKPVRQSIVIIYVMLVALCYFYIIGNENYHWIRQYSLFQSDREIITNGKELYSSIINACQLLLSKQYTQIEGFEDIANGIISNFTPKGNVFNGIQILHVGEFHGILYFLLLNFRLILLTCRSSQQKSLGVYTIWHEVWKQSAFA